jgi:hypothetical protein
MISRVVCLLTLLCCGLPAAEEKLRVTAHGMQVAFCAWQATSTKPSNGVLVLVPGYNGDGAAMLDARWKLFAETHRLVLLAPTFQVAEQQLQQGKGYYYPEQGSGAVMEQALQDVRLRTGVDTSITFSCKAYI